MPRICFFKGIAVFVYYNDHLPPHVHVRYAGEWVLLVIADGRVYSGSIHPLALSLARDLVRTRKSEVLAAWEAVMAGKKPRQIHFGNGKGSRRNRYGAK